MFLLFLFLGFLGRLRMRNKLFVNGPSSRFVNGPSSSLMSRLVRFGLLTFHTVTQYLQFKERNLYFLIRENQQLSSVTC
jgi:hypothetical protein